MKEFFTKLLKKKKKKKNRNSGAEKFSESDEESIRVLRKIGKLRSKKELVTQRIEI